MPLQNPYHPTTFPYYQEKMLERSPVLPYACSTHVIFCQICIQAPFSRVVTPGVDRHRPVPYQIAVISCLKIILSHGLARIVLTISNLRLHRHLSLKEIPGVARLIECW